MEGALLVYLIVALIVLVAALIAFGLAALLHLHGIAYLAFVVVVVLIGIGVAAAILILHRRSRKQAEIENEAPGEGAAEIGVMIDDANRRLRGSQKRVQSLDALPLVYVLGDAGSAKTSVVAQSGLDPELLAGNAAPGAEQTPTSLLNLWFARVAALVEIGPNLQAAKGLFQHLIVRTRPSAYRAAFGTGAAPRSVIVCTSAEQLLAGDGGQTALNSARATCSLLREISRILGTSVPVYVLVTKLDRVPSFAEYVRNLSEAEAKQALGGTLRRSAAPVGTYSEQTAQTVARLLDALTFNLASFRIEALNRESESAGAAGVYEFPREFGKLRKNLNAYLVELCKPGHLNANPYLRGVYFTGVRARVVEQVVRPGVTAPSAPIDTAATQVFRTPIAPEVQSAPGVVTSRRVPEWTFLARFFPEIVLGDKQAFSASTETTPARLFRRILYGSLAFFFALYSLLLIVSYSNNAALERRIADASRAIPAAGAGAVVTPGLSDLRALDDLRQVITELDGYQKDGAPLSYRFGLYRGDDLANRARTIYFDRFRPMLLNPAQANILDGLRGLPDSPGASSDYGLYAAAYNPLKAYLITTGNPEKSQAAFLVPILMRAWMGNRQPGADEQALARTQFEYYAAELLRKPPYSISPDAMIVERARAYLSHFLAVTRIYQGMLNEADKSNPAIDFIKQFADSAKAVIDRYVVRGAFTKSGYAFMQDAIRHPERYVQGEAWVLGAQSAEATASADLIGQISAQYSTDFLNEWMTFLNSASVVSCGSIKEAPDRLGQLGGASSPLLALIYTISSNTAVADDRVNTAFQPSHVLVDPNVTDRFLGPGNKDYIDSLLRISEQLTLVAQNPSASTDPAAFASVLQAAASAGTAAKQAADGFKVLGVDPKLRTDGKFLDLMQAPIQCVMHLAPSPGAAANGGGAKICDALRPVNTKFPFAAGAPAPANLSDVDAALTPDSGTLWAIYEATLKPYVVQQGSQYAQAPASPQRVNPRFTQFLTRAGHLSSELYPSGRKPASFSFSLRMLPGSGYSSATWVVDGQRVSAGQSGSFTWNGASAQRASLEVDSRELLSYQGTWAVFQLARTGTRISKSANGYRIEYPIDTSTTIAGHKVGAGGSSTVVFEISGPGADLLAGGATDLSCTSEVVK